MKNKNNIHISYEPDADVLSFSRGDMKTIDHAEEMGDVILHVNPNNEPVLVEILNAARLFQQRVQKQQGTKVRHKQRRISITSRKNLTVV